VAGKRVFLKHVIERRVELFRRHLPGHQRALREIGGQQRLPHTADRPAPQHRLNTLDDDRQFHTGLARDFLQRMALKTLEAVFRDRKNARVDPITDFDWHRGQIHLGQILTYVRWSGRSFFDSKATPYGLLMAR